MDIRQGTHRAAPDWRPRVVALLLAGAAAFALSAARVATSSNETGLVPLDTGPETPVSSTPPPEPAPPEPLDAAALFADLPSAHRPPDVATLVAGRQMGLHERGVLVAAGSSIAAGYLPGRRAWFRVFEAREDGSVARLLWEGWVGADPAAGESGPPVPLADRPSARYGVTAQKDPGAADTWRDWVVTAGPRAAAALVIERADVPPGGLLGWAVENRGTVALEWGSERALEHWDGARWARLPGPDAVTADQHYAGPGERSTRRMLRAPHLPGWYRLVMTVQTPTHTRRAAGRLVLRAQFRVS